jgi:alanyl-tRNA synthetase
MAIEDAIESGARALFGEKYGDEVRVVSMGEGGNIRGWSVELCGGTHVERTGDIGLISIISESGVAAGIRRIEAITSKAARKHGRVVSQFAKAAASELRVPIEDVPSRVATLLDERKRLERELSEAKKKLAMGSVVGVAAEVAAGTFARSSGIMQGTAATGIAGDLSGVRQVGGTSLFARTVKDFDIKDLRGLADEGKRQLGSGVVAIVGITSEGKAGIVVGVTEDLVGRFNAVDLVRKGAEALGGKGGGGRPDMAQAGGPDASKADAALAAIEAALGAPSLPSPASGGG